MTHEMHPDIRDAVTRLCAGFGCEYWRELDARMAYPTAFVEALTQSGFLASMIRKSCGGIGLSRRTCAWPAEILLMGAP